MTLQFPNSPTDGELYTDTASGNRWVWDSANTVWKSTSTFTQTITVSSTQPGSPVVGQLWWSKDYGRLFVYYDDGNSTQWVEANPADQTAGLVFNTANAAYGTANAGHVVANGAYGRANTALQNTSGTFAGDLVVTSNVGIGTSSNLNYNSRLKVLASSNGSAAEFYTPGTSYVSKINLTTDYSGAAIASNTTSLVFFTNDANTERMRIDSAGRVTKPYQPMFYAQHNNSSQSSSRYGYFSGEWVNQGGHATHAQFDQGYTHTRFTCPVAGKYLVWVGNIGNSSASTLRTYVHKNGSIASAELRTAQTGNHGTSASMLVIINASANDYIGCYSYMDDASLGFYSGVYSHMGVILIG